MTRLEYTSGRRAMAAKSGSRDQGVGINRILDIGSENSDKTPFTPPSHPWERHMILIAAHHSSFGTVVINLINFPSSLTRSSFASTLRTAFMCAEQTFKVILDYKL